MPPRQPVGVGPADLGDGAVEVAEDRRHDQPGAPLGAVLAQLGGPAVVGAGAGQQVLGAAGGDRVEPGSERGAHRAGGRVGPGEHHLGADAVVVELGVTRGRVPSAPQADLVEAVALLVLAEPLLLELVVPDEAGASPWARISSISLWRSASSTSKSSRYSGSR